MSDFPPPFDPPSLTVPYPPPEVGEGSPWAPVDAENRDRILDWWRAWWRRVFFPWLSGFINALNTWLEAAEAYIIAHAIAGYSIRLTADALNPTGTTDVTITLGEDVEFRPLAVGDVVLDQTPDSRFGIITVVIDDTHATVETQGSVKGAAGHGWWLTATPIAHTGSTDVVLIAEADRTVQLNDLVVDNSTSSAYGIVMAITDPTHVSVAFVNTLQGQQGIQGIQGIPGVVQSVVAGVNITVDNTDPANPVVAASGDLGIATIVAGTAILVDSTDPANPVVSVDQETLLPIETVALPDPSLWTGQIVYAQGIPATDDGPYYSDGTTWTLIGSGSGGGGVASVVAGTNVTVDDTDPANPVVSVDTSGGGLVGSVTVAPASSVTDQPVNFIGTVADPELQFNLIETSGAGFDSEFGGPATHLRMKADNGTFTNKIDFGANSITLSSLWDSDDSGGSVVIIPGSSPGDNGNINLGGIVNLLPLAADPAGVYVDGAIYFNTTSNTLRIYYVGAWH